MEIMSRYLIVLAVLAVAPMVSAQEQTRSLVDLARKEKKRRENNESQGKTTGDLMTNVAPSSSEPNVKKVPKLKTLESYERRLDRTAQSFYDTCRKLAGVRVMCSGTGRAEANAACYKGTDGWKWFFSSEFEDHVQSRWNKTCTDSYEFSRTELINVQEFYDHLYRDYEKLAAKKGRREGLVPRQIPPAH